jgi:hypothetical protein
VSRLTAEAARRGIRPPTVATLRRYGLTADEWLGLLKAQGWKCPPCNRAAGGALLLNTDHEHVPNWKNLPAAERKRFVRGVLCAHCNYRIVDSRLPALKARRIADYLTAYEARRDD